jgi:hypothetical protein
MHDPFACMKQPAGLAQGEALARVDRGKCGHKGSVLPRRPFESSGEGHVL